MPVAQELADRAIELIAETRLHFEDCDQGAVGIADAQIDVLVQHDAPTMREVLGESALEIALNGTVTILVCLLAGREGASDLAGEVQVIAPSADAAHGRGLSLIGGPGTLQLEHHLGK